MIGERLQYLRTNSKATQKELATILGVSKGTIAAYEQETRIPSAQFIIKIANHFDVTSDYILGLTQTPIKLSHGQQKEKNYITIPDEIISNTVAHKEFKELVEFIIFKHSK